MIFYQYLVFKPVTLFEDDYEPDAFSLYHLPRGYTGQNNGINFHPIYNIFPIFYYDFIPIFICIFIDFFINNYLLFIHYIIYILNLLLLLQFRDFQTRN